MYPYKEELLSSARAFVLAWALILVPVMSISYIIHWSTPQAVAHECSITYTFIFHITSHLDVSTDR